MTRLELLARVCVVLNEDGYAGGDWRVSECETGVSQEGLDGVMDDRTAAAVTHLIECEARRKLPVRCRVEWALDVLRSRDDESVSVADQILNVAESLRVGDILDAIGEPAGGVEVEPSRVDVEPPSAGS